MIEWTDETWNPLRGCRRISPGCEHCYAERQAARPILSGPGKPYEGLVQIGKQGPRWTGATAGPDRLDEPLRWRKPRMIFPCSMSDLFYEGHTDEQIAAVFGVMAACPQHTFQVLTKRAERMERWFREFMGDEKWKRSSWLADPRRPEHAAEVRLALECWPLPNVWLGVSVEDQQRAQERLPHLLRVPAAVRWVSAEPLLEEVDLLPWLKSAYESTRVTWAVVGGESGHGARPFDLAWARSVVAQCRAAHVPVFCKQLGARPVTASVDDFKFYYAREGSVGADHHGPVPSRIDYFLRDRKGADPAEWPADLRVREWPEVRRG